MKCLALIPARGGSKGIPRKNIAPLGGIPLIAHTILRAIEAEVFDRVIVSTDDNEIAAVSRDYGAEVPFMRPSNLAEDATKDFPVFKHALEWLSQKQGYEPEIVVNLRPTAPLRTVEDIHRTIDKLSVTSCDSVRTVCPVEHHPCRMIRIADDKAMPLLPDIQEIVPYRRQELPPVYRWNGLVDAINSHVIAVSKSMFGKDVRVIITPKDRSIDIDDKHDLMVAENLINRTKNVEVF